jgi:hypothetical protein
MKKSMVIAGMVGLLLAACQSQGPLRQISKGDELSFYNFSAPGSFEEGSYGVATLRVNHGAYRIDVRQGDNTLWWGQWGDTYTDTVIDVDVEQISERNENAYGVMCRVRGSVGQPREADPELAAIMEATSVADATDEAAGSAEGNPTETPESGEAEATPTAESTDEAVQPTTEPSVGEGDGYLFLIQGTGSYAIMRARGRDVVPLVDWTTSEHINVGPGSNHIRAICAGNYLALYVNEQFLADATDDTYTSGQVGLVASAANRLGVRVEFDNLSISAVSTG